MHEPKRALSFLFLFLLLAYCILPPSVCAHSFHNPKSPELGTGPEEASIQSRAHPSFSAATHDDTADRPVPLFT